MGNQFNILVDFFCNFHYETLKIQVHVRIRINVALKMATLLTFIYKKAKNSARSCTDKIYL
jgi:hypothetical protein